MLTNHSPCLVIVEDPRVEFAIFSKTPVREDHCNLLWCLYLVSRLRSSLQLFSNEKVSFAITTGKISVQAYHTYFAVLDELHRLDRAAASICVFVILRVQSSERTCRRVQLVRSSCPYLMYTASRVVGQ